MEFNGKKYALNLEKLKKICLSSSMEGGGTKEIEISQSYEKRDDGEYDIVGKLEHETKIFGNPQNDMMIYDIVKIMLVNLLENTLDEKSFYSTLSTSISLNTLLEWGIIIELE